MRSTRPTEYGWRRYVRIRSYTRGITIFANKHKKGKKKKNAFAHMFSQELLDEAVLRPALLVLNTCGRMNKLVKAMAAHAVGLAQVRIYAYALVCTDICAYLDLYASMSPNMHVHARIDEHILSQTHLMRIRLSTNEVALPTRRAVGVPAGRPTEHVEKSLHRYIYA